MIVLENDFKLLLIEAHVIYNLAYHGTAEIRKRDHTTLSEV